MVLLGAITLDLGPIAARLALDCAAIALLALGLFYRRHGRRDLVVLQVIFNVGLFAAVTVIAGGQVAAAVGFGLFAVLSIIRLRAETLSNRDIAYFFAAIVLGLVCAIDLGGIQANALLAALVVAAPAAIDHPRLLAEQERLTVTVDVALADPDALRGELELRLGASVVSLDIREVDYVRDTTRVQVRLAQRPGRAQARTGEDAAHARGA